MKSITLTLLSGVLFVSITKAQTCPLSEISIPGSWPFTWNNSSGNQNDIAYDVEPINTDGDGIKDDGYVVVGATYTGSTNKRDGIIFLLDANGTPVDGWGSGDGFITYGTGANDDAYAVEQASNDNLIICGTTVSVIGGSPSYNVWFLELDIDDGSAITQQSYGVQAMKRDGILRKM